jgi:hypothetical protein
MALLAKNEIGNDDEDVWGKGEQHQNPCAMTFLEEKVLRMTTGQPG